MNGSRKLKSLRTVRLGDVLYDEQKRVVTLCRSCERHFITFEAFHKHLTDCPGLKHIVKPTNPLSYDESKRETRLVSGRQELHIYDIEAVSTSVDFDLEAELEDPRWYTQPKTSVITAKTKSAPAKENVVKQIEVQLVEDEPELEVVPAKRPRTLDNTRRPILTAQQQRKTRSTSNQALPQVPTVKTKKKPILVPTVIEDLKRLEEAPKKKNTSAASVASKTPPSPPTKTSRLAAQLKPPKRTPPAPPKTSPLPSPKTPQSSPPMVSIPVDGTQKILNKLRACGVEVKRGNTLLNVTPPVTPSPSKNQEALDIMRKLQSKGIRCTKVTKH